MNITSSEFWGGHWGENIMFLIVMGTIVWFANSWRKEGPLSMSSILRSFIIILALAIYCGLCYKEPALQDGIRKGIAQAEGNPIASGLEHHNFTPLAFVITEHRILVYDKDEKVYALDGIKLDKDLTPETLTVGTNVSYTVFTKAGQLYFGRVGS